MSEYLASKKPRVDHGNTEAQSCAKWLLLDKGAAAEHSVQASVKVERTALESSSSMRLRLLLKLTLLLTLYVLLMLLLLLALLPLLSIPLLLAQLLLRLPTEGGVGVAANAVGSAPCGVGNDDAVCDLTRPHKVAARVQVVSCFHITASNAAVGTNGGNDATVAELGTGGTCAAYHEDEFATVRGLIDKVGPLLVF